jgi:hypothetical protein
MLNSPLIPKCTERNNINSQPICSKLANSREKEFKEKVKDFCLDKKFDVAEFNNCEAELSKCNLVKNDPKKYAECMAKYREKCDNYIKCTYDGAKGDLCDQYKKYKIFYNHQICNDMRTEKSSKNTKYILIGGIICIIILGILIKIFFVIRKKSK